MWPKPKQLTRRWEAVAAGPSYCRTAGMTEQEPEGSEHVAQAIATHPQVGGSDDGTLILPHGGDDWGKNPRGASMWPKPKQLTRRWEAVATGPSYCRTAGVAGAGIRACGP